MPPDQCHAASSHLDSFSVLGYLGALQLPTGALGNWRVLSWPALGGLWMVSP